MAVVPIYVILVLFLTYKNEKQKDITYSLWLLGVHIALVLFSLEMWFPLPDNCNLAISVLCIPLGLAIPRLFVIGRGTKWTVKWDGLFGLFVIIVIIGVAFWKHWDIPMGYFISSLFIYSAVIIFMSVEPGEQHIRDKAHPDYIIINPILFTKKSYSYWEHLLLWGLHLSLLFSAVGIFIGMRAIKTNLWDDSFTLFLILLLASYTMGISLPFIILKKKS